MYIFSYIHFICFLIYLLFAAVILFKDRHLATHRWAAVFFTAFSLWSLSMTVAHRPDITKETSDFIGLIFSPSWIFVGIIGFNSNSGAILTLPTAQGAAGFVLGPGEGASEAFPLPREAPAQAGEGRDDQHRREAHEGV